MSHVHVAQKYYIFYNLFDKAKAFCRNFINISGKLQSNVPRVEAGSGKCKVNVVKRELSNYLLYAGGTMGAVAGQGRPETRPQGHAHSVIARQC